MALKQNRNGTFQVKTLKDCLEAVRLADELQQDIAETETDITELRHAAADFMQKSNMVDLKFGDNRYAVLVTRTTRSWNPQRLRKVVGKKLWERVTIQVPDPEAIDALVGEGLLDLAKLEKAVDEKFSRPHLRVTTRAEGEDDE